MIPYQDTSNFDKGQTEDGLIQYLQDFHYRRKSYYLMSQQAKLELLENSMIVGMLLREDSTSTCYNLQLYKNLLKCTKKTDPSGT